MNFAPMKPIRSFVFVPGNKPTWIEKIVSAKAGALILDLEDSVPPNLKLEARAIVQSKLAWLAGNGHHRGKCDDRGSVRQ